MFFLQWARAKFYCEAALPRFKPGACLKPSSSFDVLTIWMDTVSLTRHVQRWGVSRSPPCWAEHIGMSFRVPRPYPQAPGKTERGKVSGRERLLSSAAPPPGRLTLAGLSAPSCSPTARKSGGAGQAQQYGSLMWVLPLKAKGSLV